MNITRDNYEIFFLDYMEGHLEESLLDQFLDFLEQNPDLKEELQLFENIPLPQESIAFPGKKQLYRLAPEEREAFDLKAVALLEGDLQKEDRQLLEAYLEKHPELKKEVALFEKTRLVADKSIRFPDKEKLYRRSKTMIWMNWLGRAAAVALLFWGIYALYQNEKDQTLRLRSEEVASLRTNDEGTRGGEDEGTKAQETGDRRQETGDGVATASPKSPRSPQTMKKETGDRKQDTVDGEVIVNHKGPKSPQGPQVEALEMIAPIIAMLETAKEEEKLAVSRTVNSEKIYNQGTVMTVDQYLAQRAKKATHEGLLSAHRIIRVGLNVASELSGERIGYTVKEGKVASLDFESKLLAFSIPLEKK